MCLTITFGIYIMSADTCKKVWVSALKYQVMTYRLIIF